MTQNEINTQIADIDKALASQYTPDVFKPKLEAKKKELQGLLIKDKAIDKKLTADATPAAKKPEYKAQKKEVAKKVKTVKTDTKKLLADVKAQVAEFNKGRSKKSLANDSKHKANKPGKHISKTGKFYYENRPNRTDFDPAQGLSKGGKVSNEIPRLTEKSTMADVEKYLLWLKKSEYRYHIDDNPNDILSFSKADAAILNKNSDIMWKHASDRMGSNLWQIYYPEEEWGMADGGYLGENTRKLFGDTIPVLKFGDKVTFDAEQIPLFKAETSSDDRNIQAYQRMVMANVDQIGTVKELGPGPGLITVDYPDGWLVPMPAKYLVLLSDFAKGGRIKSALMRDRKYTSNEPWELRYKRKTDKKTYKKENGGNIDDDEDYDINSDMAMLDYQYDESQPDFENDSSITDEPRGGYSVVSAGKYIGKSSDLQDAILMIKTAEKEANWFPTVWFVSDHGNYWAINDKGDEIKASGGRIKSALMRDRKYTSQQEWEKHYKRRGKKAVYKQYKANGGPIDNDYYKNHTAAQLWDAWTKEQKQHFLEDHTDLQKNAMPLTINASFRHLSTGLQNSIEIHRKHGIYESGGNIPFEAGNNINVFGYQTQNFDICPLAGQKITEAKDRINAEHKSGKDFKDHSDALRNLAECVDEILEMRKKVFVQSLSEQDIDELTTNIGMAAIYNYKIGMICDISCLKYSLSEIIKMG